MALQVAEQMADYLMNGAVTNALNMPSISAEDAPRLKPYLALGRSWASSPADHGSCDSGNRNRVRGTVTDINTDPITSVIIAHLLGAQTESINMVNALKVAEARGIKIKQSYDKTGRNWRSMINLIVKTTKRTRNVTGTLFTGKEPRVVNIEGVPVEAALTRDMLFIRNKDKPGLIGGLGMILADGGQNIADFRLGRVKAGETAVCLVSLDAPLPDDLFEKVEALPQIESVKRLRF